MSVCSKAPAARGPHARRRRWLSRLSPLSERRRGPRGGVQLRSVHSFMSRRFDAILFASSSWCMTRRLEKRGSPTIVKGSGCKL
ncbi:hypothetical protein AB1Y20_013503 [Prymnesium parvum]|uniref:Uncharacterized protein n=1 Tax=Prymnesium parvum TaxID=97485 RepID=A0AB34IGT9_PRYPA